MRATATRALLGATILLSLPVAAWAQEGPFPFPGNHPLPAAPGRAPTAGQTAALAELEEARDGRVEVLWDTGTGSPAALSGKLSRPFVGSAAEGALRFLTEQSDLIIPDPLAPGVWSDPRTAPLRVWRVTARPSTDHVSLLQYHGPLPVVGGGYTVSLRRRPGPGGLILREAVAASGRYFPGIPDNLGTNPALTREGALDFALEHLAPGTRPEDLDEPPAYSLVIYPLHGGYHLAWKIEFPTREPFARWLVYVDAKSGEILEAQDQIMYGNVSGDVWLNNWVRDPGLTNLPFRDAYVTRSGNVVVTDALGNYDDAGAASVTTSMQGPYTRVFNDDAPAVSYSGPPDVLWSYPVFNTRFDELNVFYHVNLFHDYLQSTLLFTGADIQLPAIVHDGFMFNNAYYNGSGIYFGDGDGVNFTDFAADDVIYHEYCHFMFDRAISMGYGFNEVGGMNEGAADFFGGTFNGDPELGEAVILTRPFLRNLDNKNFTPPRIYPDFLIANGFEPHRGGEVWGGVLWDIRKDIGPAFIDRAAWEGLFYLPPSGPRFLDGRFGVVQADIDLFYGANKYIIELRMWERGIGPPPDTDPFVRIIAQPPVGVAPLPVVFTAVVSDDGTIQSYDWDFGDGTVTTTSTDTVTHWYASSGTYPVTVIVTDDTGATGSWTVDVTAFPPGQILISPEEADIGFVRSDRPQSNFFGDDDVYAGYLSSFDYHGAALFRLPFVPGGTSNMIFDSAAVEFMGQDVSSKGPTGGLWALKLLAVEIDADWRQEGYNGILSARTLYTLDPALLNSDLVPGQTNVFAVSSAQLPALHDRIAEGTVSFRMDGPYGTDNLFSWDSGYDRFRENPAVTRIKPVLRIDYRLDRQAGDVNGDGVVNDTDARIVAEAVLGLRVLTTVQFLLGDADRNGSLDARDAAAIRAKAAGVIGF
ncbi:MAG: PKD domain-containing protein [Planctomycetota bacterium]|nr:PKD domain-containing protein [Planctomycetota bacterium]